MDDMKQLRQWGSHTPGHPENFVTKGAEVTTGGSGAIRCSVSSRAAYCLAVRVTGGSINC